MAMIPKKVMLLLDLRAGLELFGWKWSPDRTGRPCTNLLLAGIHDSLCIAWEASSP